MNDRHFLIATGLLFALTLAACQGQISPGATETPCVPQTVEVTRLVQPPTVTSESGTATTTAEPTSPSLPVSVQAISSSVKIDAAYFDGIVVLTKYFTLLDHGLYEEVFPMYSSSFLKRYEKYETKKIEINLKSVKVISIRPYNYWRVQQGLPPQPIPENEIRYIVGLTVVYDIASMNVGGTPTPYGQTRFASLVLENGEWKINEFNSSSWLE